MLQLNCQLNIQDGGIERLVIVNSYFWFWTIIGWGFCDIQNNQGQDKGRRLRLVILTKTSIILDITKTNVIIVSSHIERKLVMFLLLHWQEATQSTQTWHDYPWPWESLTWLLYNLQLWHHRRRFQRFTVSFQPIRKELESSMSNNIRSLV